MILHLTIFPTAQAQAQASAPEGPSPNATANEERDNEPNFDYLLVDTSLKVAWNQLPKKKDFMPKEGLKRGLNHFNGDKACTAKLHLPFLHMNHTSRTNWTLCLFQHYWKNLTFEVHT